MDKNIEKYIFDDIVDNLLMNKSVLFVSDLFTYNSATFELKEVFEDVSLYGFSFIEYVGNAFEIESVSDKFDVVIAYLSSEEDKKYLQSICSKNVFIF